MFTTWSTVVIDSSQTVNEKLHLGLMWRKEIFCMSYWSSPTRPKPKKTCWCSTNCKDCCKNCECMVSALNCKYWNKAKRAKHRMKKSVLLLCIFVVRRKDLKDNPTLLSHKWLTFLSKNNHFQQLMLALS